MISEERPITYHTVTLGALTREGDALAEISEQDAEGEPHTVNLRVPAGLPGESVTIAVEAPPMPRPGRHRRRWKPRPPRVWITEIHQASPLRVQAPCPVFGTCGGCQLQHMHYEAQLEWKRATVQQLLLDVGGFTDPPLLATVPCAIPWHYRNHMRFSVNRAGQPGLTARGSHRVLPLTDCPIAHEQINRALQILSPQKNAQPQIMIRCGAASGQMLIQPQQSPEVVQQLTEAGLDLRGETMEEILAGETFRIRPSSFFQTNTAQAEKMMQMVLDGLLSTDKHSESQQPLTIVDAYCGVGTFALLLARHVEKVIAIEESASAIKDAQWNLRSANNVEIRKGKVEELLPALAAQIDGLVIDPPRAGCQSSVLEALVQHPVSQIVYVSCDPSTLARDLNILCHLHPTYRLRSVQPLDMFPQTAHIETVAVLERTIA
ncbi:MAG TPA: class I SAM-dependent RNA methyltransferase [Ktedonosporobacter sp.]|nr:class I SAM-dependent RNA methyltransferase [Ktedonosporobacter sp.]